MHVLKLDISARGRATALQFNRDLLPHRSPHYFAIRHVTNLHCRITSRALPVIAVELVDDDGVARVVDQDSFEHNVTNMASASLIYIIYDKNNLVLNIVKIN